jgi:polyphosphate kinase
MASKTPRLFNRDISWLAFNYRVLQEAKDERVPLLERLRFLAIYSSNLDEFFRVRVASIRSLLHLKGKEQKKLELQPGRLLKRIHKTVKKQQEEFGSIFRTDIIPQLKDQGISIADESELTPEEEQSARRYFREHVAPHVQPTIIDDDNPPFLQNRAIYLIARLRPETPDGADSGKRRSYRYGIVEIPSGVSRFVTLSDTGTDRKVIFLDDVIRLCLAELFPGHSVRDAWAVKLTRDADLYIDDEFSGDLVEKIRKGLRRRSTGIPSRFLYDLRMPKSCLASLMEAFDLEREDVVPGGRYHNFHDLFAFPTFGLHALEFEPLPPLPHELGSAPSIFTAIARHDQMLHFPYHSYDTVLGFLADAAADPDVESISITLYRVASGSHVAQSLIAAAQQGKRVTAFVEVKARFDEESNLHWAEEMERAGVQVLYSFPGLKVHAKLCLVTRREGSGVRRYAYLATGNFNEKTSRIYCDHGLFTADPRITDDVASVFTTLCGAPEEQKYQHLLVAPGDMRRKLIKLINNEISNAKEGRQASMILKLNSMEDEEMIEKLYEASRAGVGIDIIVRGICCLVPGVKGMSDRIRVTSIVDRFLEHARIFIFHNDGAERYYLASADWMTRNLSRRVEVAFPIYDEGLRSQLRHIIDMQLGDEVKGRIIDAELRNAYYGAEPVNGQSAQRKTYEAVENGWL